MSVGEIDTALSKAALSAAEPVAWLVKRYDLEGILLDTELSFVRPTIRSTCRTDMEPLYAAPPAPSVAVKALEGAFKHFKVVYDPPNGISINEATRAEAIKLAASALYATLSQAEIETLRACEDWKATFEIMRIRRVDKAAEAWRSSQKIVDNLLDRGLLEFGEPNTTYRITDAGRSALSAQVQDVAEVSPVDYMRRHDAAIAAYEANTPNDYRYSALALRKAVDAAFAVAAAPAKQEG